MIVKVRFFRSSMKSELGAGLVVVPRNILPGNPSLCHFGLVGQNGWSCRQAGGVGFMAEIGPPSCRHVVEFVVGARGGLKSCVTT